VDKINWKYRIFWRMGLKIIFLGSSNFSIPPLDAIVNSRHEVLAVITQPGKRKGRGLIFEPTPVKKFAEGKKLQVFEFQDINTEDVIDKIFSLSADLFVVAAFGQILSKKFLKIPRIFCIGIHPSLLPKYRGSTPVAHAILNREEYTGITIFKVVRKVDAGPIILQERVKIPKDITAGELENRLSILGAKMVVDVLGMVEAGNFKLVEQDERIATYTEKLTKENGRINWDARPEKIESFVRAMQPYPTAFTFWKNKRLIIRKVKVGGHQVMAEPGNVCKLEKDTIYVSCKNGSVGIIRIQPEGKRDMSAREFLNGYKVCVGDSFK
jgi:methionyl-tRNA formyltransferase